MRTVLNNFTLIVDHFCRTTCVHLNHKISLLPPSVLTCTEVLLSSPRRCFFSQQVSLSVLTSPSLASAQRPHLDGEGKHRSVKSCFQPVKWWSMLLFWLLVLLLDDTMSKHTELPTWLNTKYEDYRWVKVGLIISKWSFFLDTLMVVSFEGWNVRLYCKSNFQSINQTLFVKHFLDIVV